MLLQNEQTAQEGKSEQLSLKTTALSPLVITVPPQEILVVYLEPVLERQAKHLPDLRTTLVRVRVSRSMLRRMRLFMLMEI